MRNWLLALLLGFVFSLGCFGATEMVRFSYAGNYKGMLSFPPGEGPFPMIIYNYGDWYKIGQDKAKSHGYDLDRFIEVFNSWGVAVMIPYRRHRNVNAVKGAIRYVKKHPKVDSQNVHLVGLASGATMSLLALDRAFSVTSMILMNPYVFSDKGKLSMNQILRDTDTWDVPVLFLMAMDDDAWRLDGATEIFRVLRSTGKTVQTKMYPQSRFWMHDPTQVFMHDIHHFLFKKPPPVRVIELDKSAL